MVGDFDYPPDEGVRALRSIEGSPKALAKLLISQLLFPFCFNDLHCPTVPKPWGVGTVGQLADMRREEVAKSPIIEKNSG